MPFKIILNLLKLREGVARKFGERINDQQAADDYAFEMKPGDLDLVVKDLNRAHLVSIEDQKKQCQH